MEEVKKLNPSQMKRFLKHLCLASMHYHARDEAYHEFKHQVKHGDDPDALQERLNALIKKDIKVAALGKEVKEVDAPLVAEEFTKLREERDDLHKSNISLRHALHSTQQTKRASQTLLTKVKRLEESYEKAVANPSISKEQLRSIREKLDSFKEKLIGLSA